MFGERQIVAFIRSVNASAKIPETTQMFESQYFALKVSPAIRLDFLHRVNLSINKFNLVSLQGIVAGISKLSKEFGDDPTRRAESIYTRQIVLSAASELRDSIGVEKVLSDVIKEAESDGFATELLNDVTSRSKGLRPEDDREKLLQAFSERMQEKYGPSGGHSKFDETEVDIVSLGRWAHTGAQGREQVREYLRKEFRRNPRNVGKFLASFPSIPEDRLGANLLSSIDIYFSKQELRELVAEYGPLSYATKEEAKAVERFNEAIEKSTHPDY
jgi:hypothetical protein